MFLLPLTELIFLLAVILTILPTRFENPVSRMVRKSLYYRYLRSNRWRKKRQKVLERDGHMCQNCGCDVSQFADVHHKTYKRLYRERLSDLITLCRSCHNKIHKKAR